MGIFKNFNNPIQRFLANFIHKIRFICLSILSWEIFQLLLFIVVPIVGYCYEDYSLKVIMITSNILSWADIHKLVDLIVHNTYRKWLIAILLDILLFCFIRFINKNRVYKNHNLYGQYPYYMYWLYSNLLGIKKCNLVLIPIHMIFTLGIKSTFREYLFGDTLNKNYSCKVKVKYLNRNSVIKVIIIEDTYPIHEYQIPEKFRNYSRVEITRVRKYNGERVYCEDLVDKVHEVVKALPQDTVVYILSTSNPRNTYNIALKTFLDGKRGNIKELYVFQQESIGKRIFCEKPFRII